MLVQWGGQGSEPCDEPTTLLACVLGTVGLVSFFCFFFFLIDLFLFLAVPVFVAAWAFSTCGKPGLLSVVCGLLIAVTFLVVEHGL